MSDEPKGDEPERDDEPARVRFVDPPPRATSMSTTFEGRLRLAERLLALSGLPFVAAGIAGWITAGERMSALIALVTVALFTIFFVFSTLLPSFLAWLMRRRHHGLMNAELREDGLHIERSGMSERVARTRIAMAWCKTDRVVEILTHDGDEIEIVLESGAQAGRLVKEIRAATDRSRTYSVALEADVLRLLRKAAWSFLPVAVGGMTLFAGAWGLIGALGGGLLGWLGAKGTPRLSFGADGVSIGGRIRKRYVPYHDIEDIEVREGALGASVRLVLKSGKRLRVAFFVPGARAQLVKALALEGVEMAESGERAGAHVAALDRAGTDPGRWRERLGTILRESGYRGAALESEKLLSLMRNPAAKAEQRVAAALALRTEPGGIARIRVAAEVSAEPTVRAALEQLAEEEIDEPRFERALERLRVS